jgi:hypothetical protein
VRDAEEEGSGFSMGNMWRLRLQTDMITDGKEERTRLPCRRETGYCYMHLPSDIRVVAQLTSRHSAASSEICRYAVEFPRLLLGTHKPLRSENMVLHKDTTSG